MRVRKITTLILIISLLVAFSWLALLYSDNYLLVSMGVVVFAIIFIMIRFENRKLEARELVLLAVLAAIAAVGRIPFASIPSVQPTTFVVMMAGLVFGAESGFMIGVVAALTSNMVLGQGPWTPWQMLAWGLVGVTAGILRNSPLMKNQFGKIAFAVIWGFLFGLIMNIWTLLAFSFSGELLTTQSILAYLASSLLYDSFHAVSNVLCLLLFGETWFKILSRFKLKYGLLDKKR